MRGSGPRVTFWLSQPSPESVRESGMPKASPLRLGVNVDHVATLRNARAGERPDPVRAALVAIEAGAARITPPPPGGRPHNPHAHTPPPPAQNSNPLHFPMSAPPPPPPIPLPTPPPP